METRRPNLIQVTKHVPPFIRAKLIGFCLLQGSNS